MKILAIEKEAQAVDWEQEKEILKEEAQCAYQLYLNGVIREIYFDENHSAILILECENKAAARLILNTLPLVKKKLIGFELMELKPYTGWSRLT